MTSQAFTDIIIGLIMVMSAIITSYVLPFIQTRINTMEMEQIYSFTKKCVEWANQTIPAELTEKKKQQVMGSVQAFIETNMHIKLEKYQIDTIIEAFVIECKKGL